MTKFDRRTVLVGLLSACASPRTILAETVPAWKRDAHVIVLNPQTGRVLVEQNPDKPAHPASLTKLMTGAVIFEAMKSNPAVAGLGRRIKISQETINTIRKHSRGLADFERIRANAPYKIGDLLVGMGARSDAISTLALVMYIAEKHYGWKGSELDKNLKFVKEMNALAEKLGMKNTEFSSVTGIDAKSTNEDLARLMYFINTAHPELTEHAFGQPRINIPDLTHWKVPTSRLFQSRPERVHNAKTGYTNGGYAVAFTYMKNGSETPLIAIVTGVSAPNGNAGRVRRNNLALEMLTEAYERLEQEGPNAGRFLPGLIGELGSAPLQAPYPPSRPLAPQMSEVPPSRPAYEL